MPIKFRIPIAEPLLDDAEKKAVLDVMESGRISQGERVQEFEEKIASYLGRKYAVACSSGTCANELLMMGLTRPNAASMLGRENLFSCAVPVCTSVAVTNPLLFAGVRPVFYDLDNKLCMDVQKIAGRRVNSMVLNVHAYGSYPHDFAYLVKFCHDDSLPLLEDACVALGSMYGERKLGTFGVASSLSFYVNKLITAGEGGMVVTDEPHMAEYCREYVNHGRKKSVYHEEWFYHHLGRNAKMTDLQAAIGLAQFDKINRFIDARKKIGQYLYDNLKDVGGLITYRPSLSEVPWAFWIVDLMKERRNMPKISMTLQTEYGIETRPMLPILPKLRIYRMNGSFPMGEASQNGFIVSCSPAIIAHGDLDYLVDGLREVLG